MKTYILLTSFFIQHFCVNAPLDLMQFYNNFHFTTFCDQFFQQQRKKECAKLTIQMVWPLILHFSLQINWYFAESNVRSHVKPFKWVDSKQEFYILIQTHRERKPINWSVSLPLLNHLTILLSMLIILSNSNEPSLLLL